MLGFGLVGLGSLWLKAWEGVTTTQRAPNSGEGLLAGWLRIPSRVGETEGLELAAPMGIP